MFQSISLAAIYGVMMFIWTFVYLNRSHDRVNQSFLLFLSNILAWMVLNNLSDINDGTIVTLVAKTIYWLSMMFLSITFLYFIYRLLQRKIDWLFYTALALNIAMIGLRYCYPINYTDPTFWRMDDPVVAPIMSLSFSLPAIYALYLVLRKVISTTERRQRAQFSYILFGIGLALIISVFSEYILPAVFHIDEKLYLMHSAIAIFVVAIFISIMRYRLLNLRSDYIYRSLFLNAGEGILIVNRTGRIVSINRVGKELLHDEQLDAGDFMTNYIPDYRFDTNYCQQEFVYVVNGERRVLSMTQYPIDEWEQDTSKLLVLSDLTQTHLRLEREKEELLEKTIVDELTGLYNKQFLREKYLIDSREAVHTALMFIDVDDFKAINDTYGHLVGDKVLKELAACIKNNLRVANDAIRFGGDEFLVVLEQVGLEEAYRIAERLRDCAGELEFSGGDTMFGITLSIGLIEGTAPLTVLLEKADRAMYASKSKGKNRTTVFSEADGDGAFHMTLA